jgi:hypothetical protein
MSTFSLLCLKSVETVCYFFIFMVTDCLSLLLRRVCSSCSTSGTRRVNLVTNPVINHERGKDLEVINTSGTYQVCPFVLFLPAIVLAVLLQYTDSDFPFGVFKLFLEATLQ